MVLSKTSGLRVFLGQHNEHRIICQEVVFVLDILFFRGRQILPLTVSFLCYFGVWVVLARTFLSESMIALDLRWMAVLLAGIVIGFKASAAALATAFQLQWTFLELSAVLAFASLARLAITSRNIYLAGAILASAVATYSSANGLLLWPLLLAAGLLLRLKRQQIFFIVASGLVFGGLFFVGYRSPNRLNLANFFLHPFYALGFIGSYLSMPFGDIKSLNFGAYVGVSSLAIAIVLAVVAKRDRLLLSPVGIVLFGWYVFALMSVVLTAAGRMAPNDPSFADAKAPRYCIFPLVTWAVLILITVWISARRNWRIAPPVAIILFCLLLFGLAAPKLKWWFQRVGDRYASEQLSALSVEDGLLERLLLRKTFPQAEFLFPLISYLRENHLSVFADDRRKWLGQPATRFGRKVREPAAGQVSYVFPLQSGLEVVGWVDQSDRSHPPQWLLLTNEKDRIVGFARKLPAGFPQHLRSSNVAYSLGWVGFVNFQYTGLVYSAYVIDNSSLIPIPGSFSAPQVSSVSPNELGPVLPGIHWQTSATWTLNGIPPLTTFGVNPPGNVYSSWSGSSLHTGQLVSNTFATPSNGCLILPVFPGPYIGGQSVELMDADNNQIVGRAPMQEGQLLWEFWRFAFPPSVKHVRVVANDQGVGWGQWTAISDPVACRSSSQ